MTKSFDEKRKREVKNGIGEAEKIEETKERIDERPSADGFLFTSLLHGNASSSGHCQTVNKTWRRPRYVSIVRAYNGGLSLPL